MNQKTALRIVLVLSLVGSGVSFLSYLMIGLFYSTFQSFLQTFPESMPEEMAVAAETLASVPRTLFILQAFFYGLSLTGVIFMWNVRGAGFHCYTLAQLALLALPVLFMGKAYFAIGDAMMTALFVGFYYVMLRKLGAFGQSGTHDDANVPE